MTGSSKRCHTILVIEDDKSIRDVVQHSLEMEGYHVVAAGDGKAGLDALKTVVRPCLILLDLMLPIMNGWEFLDELRKSEDLIIATIPVVVTSAVRSPSKETTQQAQGFIKKPIDLELLLRTVEKYCGIPPHSP